MKKDYILYFFLTIIIVLLGLIFFKENIQSYFKTKKILDNTNIMFISEVFFSCYDVDTDRTIASRLDWQRCIDAKASVSSDVEKFQQLIQSNKGINCSNFESKAEAEKFFDYTSGEKFASVMQHGVLGITPNSCAIDPYGLDSDHDCEACEDYWTQLDQEQFNKEADEYFEQQELSPDMQKAMENLNNLDN